MIDRRQVLRGFGAAGLALVVSGCGPMLTRRGERPAQVGRLLPSSAPAPRPYEAELPRVPVVRPDRQGRLRLVQRVGRHEILPGLTTEVWGYDGLFPGPTIEARRGQGMALSVRNELPTPTSTHLHGGITPAESDGGPLDLVMPAGFDPRLLDVAMANGHGHAGHEDATPSDIWTLHDREREYHYPLAQRAGLLWYHDHRMDFSAPQVWRGLAGMFVVRDEVEEGLELPTGEHELLLMLTDRSFGRDGELLYPAEDPTLTTRPGVEPAYMDGVLGDVMLVNGAPSPITRVAATRYRLRLLNACNARALRLRFRVPGRRDLPFHQIGTDVGLLAAPLERSVLDLHPAERVDLLLDLSGLPIGTEIELVHQSEDPTRHVMKLVVDRSGPRPRPLPTVLDPGFEVLDPGAVAARRRFDFRLGSEGTWTINGRPYDPADSLADPVLDTVERWTFSSDFNHPVHVHLGHFQVVEENGRRVPVADRGWKDTVNVEPFGTVDVLIRFTQFRGSYMLHCHNLEHEDMAMMANFTVR